MQFSDDRSITGYIQPEFVDEKKFCVKERGV